MKLLHVVASPRKTESNTLRIADAFLESLRAKHPELEVETLYLFGAELPALAGANTESKYSLMAHQPLDETHRQSWARIEALIEQFLSADINLISTPMWNLSIPYALKYYIDCIVQPGYLFKYDEQGKVVGLAGGRKLVCVTTRGGDYSKGSPFSAFDFQESYLRAIFGFVGVTEIHFINGQPMDVTPGLRTAATAAAIQQARLLVSASDWGPATGTMNASL